MKKYLTWLLCILSLGYVIYFIVAVLWINNIPLSEVPGREYASTVFFAAVFLLTANRLWKINKIKESDRD